MLSSTPFSKMKRVLASTLSLIVAVLLCEFFILSQFKIPVFAPHIFSQEVGWEPRPNATGWNLESGELVAKGPLGWNDNNVGEAIKPRCAINFYGDSFLEAAQFSADRNFASLLEVFLNKSTVCKDFSVNNFGLSGTGTLQQSRILLKQGAIFPAEHSALFVFLGNDLSNNLFTSSNGLAPGFVGFPDKFEIREATYTGSQLRESIRNFVAPLTDHSDLLRLLANSLLNRSQQQSGTQVPYDAQSDRLRGIQINPNQKEWQLEVLRLSLIKNVVNAQQNNTKLTVFLLPTAKEIAFGDTSEVNEIKTNIFEWCSELNIICKDIYPELRRHNRVSGNSQFHLSLGGHFNLRGHSEVARILNQYYSDEFK